MEPAEPSGRDVPSLGPPAGPETAGPVPVLPDPPAPAPPNPFVLDYRRPASDADRPRPRPPFGPVTSFWVAHLATGAAGGLVALLLPQSPVMDAAVPCMVCGSFASAALVGALAFGAGLWARSRLTPHALEARPWWVAALFGSGCAIIAVGTLYLPEAYANFGSAALTLVCPAAAGAATLRTPRRKARGVASSK